MFCAFVLVSSSLKSDNSFLDPNGSRSHGTADVCLTCLSFLLSTHLFVTAFLHKRLFTFLSETWQIFFRGMNREIGRA